MRSGDRDQSGTDMPHTDAPAPTQDEGRESRLNRVVKARMVGALGLAVVASILCTFAARHDPFGEAWLLLVFVAFQGVSWACAIGFQPNDNELVKQFDEAVFVVCFLLLPHAGVVTVFAFGTAIGFMILRANVRSICMNSGIMALAAGSAILTASATQHVLGGSPAATLVSVFAGSIALALVNDTLLSLAFHFILGTPFWSEVVAAIRFDARRSPFLVLLGFLTGSAAQGTTWLVVLAAPLLGGLQYVLAEHMRSRRDLQRTQDLFESSVEVHGHVDAVGVEEALTTAAARLLRCGVARFSDQAPVDDQWGANLQRSDQVEKWLIVEQPTTGFPIDRQALQL
ncbi:MAG: hypothetical protein QOG30_2596, partial [Acidimicrobiaceae bacterium]